MSWIRDMGLEWEKELKAFSKDFWRRFWFGLRRSRLSVFPVSFDAPFDDGTEACFFVWVPGGLSLCERMLRVCVYGVMI